MSIDDHARRAGRSLRQLTAVDVEAALEDLQRAAPRRRRAHVAVTCAVVAVLLLAGSLGWLLPEDSSVVPPANQPISGGALRSVPPVDRCEAMRITCHGDRRYTVALRVPMDWTLPEGFEAPYSGDPPQSDFIETYSDFGAGLSVLQGVHAAENHADPAAIPGLTTAEQLANWIAQRPFLSASSVRTGQVDGHRAWVVDVEVPPGVPPGPAICNSRVSCYPVLLQGTRFTGAWRGITSRYTVLDLPGAGVTVLWSWSLNDQAIPSTVDEVIQSIRFN